MLVEVLVLAFVVHSAVCLDFKYHRTEELKDFLEDYADNTKEFYTRLYSIGKSFQSTFAEVVFAW